MKCIVEELMNKSIFFFKKVLLISIYSEYE